MRTVSSGVLSWRAFGQKMKTAKGELHFVQISDSHINFNKPANSNVVGTIPAIVDKINALPQEPDFIIHTGDVSHTSKPSEYDTSSWWVSGLASSLRRLSRARNARSSTF
jgi:Icc protein